jgi:pantoate--beta-alanine ligase
MQIIPKPRDMQQLCADWRCSNQTIGFVPTMGALHAGHLELCRRAKSENDHLLVSIFVNPTQFGPREDLDRYPHPFERDCDSLRDLGCDAIFAPTSEGMYGNSDFACATWVDVAPLNEMWEGVTRPGHLRGVATVVAKLFNICSPSRAYFGEKDFQQLRVVQSLVADLNFPLEIVPCATVRESDGLAMSSRNVYLSPEERQSATVIFRAMNAGRDLAASGERDVTTLGQTMDAVLASEPDFAAQYVAIVDAQTLAPLRQLDGREARILVAGTLGKTRLIDNLALKF